MHTFVARIEQAGLTFDVWYDEEEKEFETFLNGHQYHDKDQEELIFDVVACEADQNFGRPVQWNS